METFYFPLFLVVLAVVVLWIFGKARSHEGRGRSKPGPVKGRLIETDTHTKSIPRKLGPAARLQSGQGKESPGDIWQTRRERARQETFSQSRSSGSFYAGYVGPDSNERQRGTGAHELRDQQVSDTEHQSIDEYLSKHAREKAAAAAKAAKEAEAAEAARQGGDFSMTAIKYEEPSEEDEAEAKAQKEDKKQAGFKP